MRRRPWFKLLASLAGYGLAILALMMVLNLSGNCYPGVADCGETGRKISFVVLGIGTAWLAYLVAKFIRRPMDF
jgi:hypothetical protein